MPDITPFLWFDNQAEEAAKFYCSIFPNSKILTESDYPEDSPGEAGTVMVVRFSLDGKEFMALNGGPEFTFTPAISFMVNVQTQDELDRYWNALLEGGAPSQCGWLTDKYGLSWQIVPTKLGELMSDPDEEKSSRVFQAMLKMVKLDIDALQRAYDGLEHASR